MIKLFKKIVSFFITLLIMLILATLSTTMILRSILSFDNIIKIINNTTNTVETDNLINNIVKDNNTDANLNEYVDTKELNKILEKYVEELISYKLGNEQAPKLNTEEFNDFINETIDKYEEKTGNKIDRSKIEETLEKADNEMSNNKELPPGVDENQLKMASKIYNLIINKTISIILLIVLILLIIALFFINKDILKTLQYISSSFLMNGICILILPFILKVTVDKPDVINIVLKSFIKYGIISLSISVIITISYFIIKKYQKKSA